MTELDGGILGSAGCHLGIGLRQAMYVPETPMNVSSLA